MRKHAFAALLVVWSLLLFAGAAPARDLQVYRQLAAADVEVDRVGDVDGTAPVAAKALQDTVWIADWDFDSFSGCTSAGWVTYDNRILNDGSNYWHVGNDFAGSGHISGNAAILSKHDLCWDQDGYGNNWDYSIVLKYKGAAATLSFDYLFDSEPGFDFVQVETDSAGLSEARVNYSVDPEGTASAFRYMIYSADGVVDSGQVTDLALQDFAPGGLTNEVYIRFVSDGGYSDEDGYYLTFWKAGLVVDNISVVGDPGYNYTEDFEGTLNSNVSLVNSADATPFGEWMRLYWHVTDNEKCAEDPTCAWIGTDPFTHAYFPDMAFGPGGTIIRNWVDECLVSPWVSLSSTPSATGTILSFRRLLGNDYNKSRIVHHWVVRGRGKVDNTDTSATGDSIDCNFPWAHDTWFGMPNSWSWTTVLNDITASIPGASKDIQVQFRIGDGQLIFGAGPPKTLNPGPGPYLDRVRIGRRVLVGPVWNIGIDRRTQAQDCFPTIRNGILPGKHFSPDAGNIFGTCAFSQGTELGINGRSPNLITGDSILVEQVSDARGAGGVNSVKWYGAIYTGVHAGKAPAPYTVGANGFFEVQPDTVRNSSGMKMPGWWFVSLDDDYFRPGDGLKYFWYATDAAGGGSSYPSGITPANFPPASVAAAEAATRGLVEVNCLPTVDWDSGYVARVQADLHGKLNPTPAEIANSHQRSCILYVEKVNTNRGSGDLNRTHFMYTLDQMGYRGHYDVYDHQGFGNTNNHVGGRANVAQCSQYALIVYDMGRGNPPDMPDGVEIDGSKINQAQWFRDYLAAGATSVIGTHTLWVIGENTAWERPTNPIFSTDMALGTITNDQRLNVNPEVEGVASFTDWNGCVMPFVGDKFVLAGGCPSFRAYDMAASSGTGVITHKYKVDTVFSTGGAAVMNKRADLHWNTVWMGFNWFDIRDPNFVAADPQPPQAPPGNQEATLLASKILGCVLPTNCLQSPVVTGTGDPSETGALPKVTRLFPNVPNPFNPTTTIKFDLARDGHVRLQIFDVAGHRVKTLVDSTMKAGGNIPVTWNGLDEGGHRVPSGVYFYQLATDETTATRKMVMMK